MGPSRTGCLLYWNLGPGLSPFALFEAQNALRGFLLWSFASESQYLGTSKVDRLPVPSWDGASRIRVLSRASDHLQVLGSGYSNPLWDYLDVADGPAIAATVAAALAAAVHNANKIMDIGLRISNLGKERERDRTALLEQIARSESGVLQSKAERALQAEQHLRVLQEGSASPSTVSMGLDVQGMATLEAADNAVRVLTYTADPPVIRQPLDSDLAEPLRRNRDLAETIRDCASPDG